ncbi:MAG: hypothetical protein F6K65_25525 [Moorea sp. SIO3C2]|nr:hypothetical protein [Moorena sp. SIO3C2]
MNHRSAITIPHGIAPWGASELRNTTHLPLRSEFQNYPVFPPRKRSHLLGQSQILPA